MILVGAAFGGDVDLGRFVSKLGGVNARLHLEFLYRVDRRQEGVGVEVGIRVNESVKSKVIVNLPLPGDRNLRDGSTVTSLAGRGSAAHGESRADVGTK